ncbi:MAG: 3-hydroxyacyl-CoA dehydrogenase family protein [Saprospiraceae bacterium]|nr:3-hydroxyacyl-CoA dehydrogenase family protein [Saprospiraceae bacterium]
MRTQNNGIVKSTVGVVGLGLMGSSIASNLIIAGHKVIGIVPVPENLDYIKSKILRHLNQAEKLDLTIHTAPEYLSRFTLSEDFSDLSDCDIVIECVIEDLDAKCAVFEKIEKHIINDAILGTNTSAIPISLLQKHVRVPARFLGLHWSEPAYSSRFLEIICGDQTILDYAEKIYQLAESWGKEPILLRKDIRGFVTNRLMYAVYREALQLHENLGISLEDLDKAFRYDAGSWMTIMGIFQRMDYQGLDCYKQILQTTFPLLNNSDQVPRIMQKIKEENAQGIRNQRGLYTYTEEEAKEWEQKFSEFSNAIYKLSSKYLNPIQ